MVSSAEVAGAGGEKETRGVDAARDSTRSAFLELPQKIMRKIFDDYKYTKRELRNARLACYALNECTKHFVLESVYVYGDEGFGPRKQPKDLLSGPNAFEECTKQLTIGKLHHREAMGYWNLTLDQTRDSQATAISIIIKLRSLRTVVFDSMEGLLSSQMVAAAFAHPAVENIRIQGDTSYPLMYNRTPVTCAPPATKSLSIHISHPAPRPVPQDMTLLRSIVRLCSALQTLDIRVYSGSMKLSDILQTPADSEASAHIAPASPSALRSLYVSHRLLVSSSCPATLQYLSNLTSLSIPNRIRTHDELWPAFHGAGIQLKHLTVELGTENLAQYLLGYLGLETFEAVQMRPLDFSDSNSDSQKNHPACKRVLHAGLSHHRDSLVDICIRHPGKILSSERYQWIMDPGTETEEWVLDKDQLAWLEQFRKLRKLEVSLWINSDGSVVNFLSFEEFLETLLLTRMPPKLQNLAITRKIGIDSKCSQILLRALMDFDFLLPFDPPHYRISYFHTYWWVEYDEDCGAYKFKTDSERMPWLKAFANEPLK